MPETPFEERVRSTLREQADKQRFDPQTVKSTAARARRRLQRDATVAAALALIALAGLIRIGGPLMATPTPAAPPVRLGDEVITFAAGNAVKTIHADGSDESILAKRCPGEPCSISGISWSPTGSQLAFATSTTGGIDPLYSVRSDGTGLHALRDCPAGPPKWSPDGSRIAAPHDRPRQLPNGEHTQVRPIYYACAAQGGDARRMSFETDWGPSMAWSPDGRELAYLAVGRIVVESADGTGARAIARVSAGPVPYSEIAWSADGRIAYTNYTRTEGSRYGHTQLWVVNADGSDPQLVLEAPNVFGPVWSPDGSRIAVDTWDGQTGSLVVVGADGLATSLLNGSLSDPAWDPSGAALAVFRGHDLVVVPTDGSFVRTVASSIHHPGPGPLAWRPTAP